MKGKKGVELIHLNKILVPVDLSEYSLEAVEFACGLALAGGAQVYLLHVIPIEASCVVPQVDLHSETKLRDQEELAMQTLDAFIHERLNGVHRIVRVIRRGDPSHEIVKFARDERIDLTVMATHGRTGLAHVLMGSVAEKVMRSSIVPLLTVKPLGIRESLLHADDVEEQLHLKINPRASCSLPLHRKESL